MSKGKWNYFVTSGRWEDVGWEGLFVPLVCLRCCYGEIGEDEDEHEKGRDGLNMEGQDSVNRNFSSVVGTDEVFEEW